MAVGTKVPSGERRPAVGVSISCRSVSAGYLGTQVLRDISFTIDESAIYVVLGPDGAGKTTLFRTLPGILRPTPGEVYIGGARTDRQESRSHLHYMSRVDGTPDDFWVREALEFYARVERPTAADVERVLDLLDIRELSRHNLARLIAGQKKRVSTARNFLREQAIYLLDEPTSNLDPKVAREIRTVILEPSREKFVLYSSHNRFEVREVGRYALVIKDGRLARFDYIENLRGSRLPVGIRVHELSRPSRSSHGRGVIFFANSRAPTRCRPFSATSNRTGREDP